MTNPVGRSSSSPPSNPNPNQPPEGSLWGRIGSFLKEIFSRYPQPEPSPATFSSDVSSKEVGLSKDVILSRWVNSQPENAKAEAAAIVAILKETDLDEPFELRLLAKTNIISLPDVLQNCKMLSCSNCTSLRTLPELPACSQLVCNYCTRLQSLPELPACSQLCCSDCTSLRTLPELPACSQLVCNYCTALQSLPELPACSQLVCNYCTSLQALPALPLCTELTCRNCTSLRTLPELPLCTELNCSRCTRLETLPALPVCRELRCSGCTSLESLPALPECRELYCNDCTSLESLPALPECGLLDCINCTSLNTIQELPVCRELRCFGCTSLQSLPALLVCNELICSSCTRLVALPELPLCSQLVCNYCTSLQSLPALPLCTELTCRNCTSLQSIPALPECRALDCINCTNLRTLPALEACELLHCWGCTNLQSLPTLPVCKELDCYGCNSLMDIRELPACKKLVCNHCTNLQALPELPICETLHCQNCGLQALPPTLPACSFLDCSNCTNLHALPRLPTCKALYCKDCLNLLSLPALEACRLLVCPGCTNLQEIPALPVCKRLHCQNCRSLKALPEAPLLEELFCDGCPDLVVLVWTRIRPELCTIDGVKYFPIPLTEGLRAQLAPPVPVGASIKHLQGDLQSFIAGLTPTNLRVLRKEMQGVAESGSDDETLKSYKQELSTWERMLFSRLETREPGFGTPKKDTEELTKFYENIEYYLLHLDGFLSKRQNRDAFVERLRILQTQSACGARFIAELEQLFSLNCVSIEHATLQNQFAQIASTEAKRAIERMYPGGDVHNVNQAMFQLREFLTGSYIKDQLSHPMDQEGLMFQFLKCHTSTSLVETILIGLKPSSPMEEVFADYLKENFSPELTQGELQKVQDKVTQAWNEIKEGKILAFRRRLGTPSLTAEEQACKSEESLGKLLDSKEKSFIEANFKQSVQAKKDKILYKSHFDKGANKWKPEIIAKALQKMGILATLDELIPKL